MGKKKLRKYLVFIIFFVFIVNFLAGQFYWYFSIWYFDMIVHFLSGFWLGLAYIWFLDKSPNVISKNSKKLIVYMFLFIFLIAVGWEVFEFFVNEVVVKNPFNYLDTVSDICFGLAGGVLAFLYFSKRIMLQSVDGTLEKSFNSRF